jgi:hypothetical protein
MPFIARSEDSDSPTGEGFYFASWKKGMEGECKDAMHVLTADDFKEVFFSANER